MLTPVTKELAANLIGFQTCSLCGEYSMLQTSDDIIIRTKLYATGDIKLHTQSPCLRLCNYIRNRMNMSRGRACQNRGRPYPGVSSAGAGYGHEAENGLILVVRQPVAHVRSIIFRRDQS
jgi:hypothetical protein